MLGQAIPQLRWQLVQARSFTRCGRPPAHNLPSHSSCNSSAALGPPVRHRRISSTRVLSSDCESDTEEFLPPARDGDIEPGLYVVATPIGNLEDVSFRAIRILKSVNFILAEDTRHSRKLLNYYDIPTPAISFHAHNEKGKQAAILRRLQGNEPCALISDAGMPAISDPGAALVAAAVEAGIKVIPIPGPCALVNAVVGSGLPTDSFQFCGFLPPKTGARKARLQELASQPATLLFYAPPHGLQAVLEDMSAVLGPSRSCCVARELTKLHEEFWRGSLEGAVQEFSTRVPRGEICLVVQGATGEHAAGVGSQADGVSLEEAALALVQQGVSVSDASRQLVRERAVSRKVAYSAALAASQKLRE